jgi:hypothetical protein
LRMLGAQFYELPPRRRKAYDCYHIDDCYEADRRYNLELAILDDGSVWVYNYDNQSEGRLSSSGLWNAYTMKERAEVIERLGGKFCPTFKACPELDGLIDEPN